MFQDTVVEIKQNMGTGLDTGRMVFDGHEWTLTLDHAWVDYDEGCQQLPQNLTKSDDC